MKPLSFKKLNLHRFLWPVALLFFCVGGVSGQYRFDQWTADNGLPQNSVARIAPTADGYLWLTTNDGLVRFDGVRFTVFNKGNSPNLPNNRLVKMLLIRARGYYRTGYFSASDTTEDKIQNAFPVAPTAATVSVSGRVFVSGRGLTNAFVILTDQNGHSRSARTSSFGYYQFDEVEVGRTDILSVQSKRYQFTPQVIGVNGVLSELNFYSDGESRR